ncbi:MAG: cupin-like domain-containing protein [Bacteroidetes bacterium]|jgi:hypothetical protein|nr:cupin-like domain-containing protein [Bacteroidota bacterium]MCB0603711.1 cupin-like domain-containing protein [Saprospiraceae bacterium]
MILKPVDRRSNLSKKEFKTEYLDKGRPVVITDLSKDWPGLSKWSFDFFKENYGHLNVPLVDKTFHEAGSGYMAHRTIPFKKYIEAIEKGSSDLRLFLFNIFDAAPELRQDFIWPDIMDGFMKTLPYMFFGGEGSITPMHYDIDCPSNFLTHFQTRKKIILFDPSQSKYLYHQPFTVQSDVDLHNPDYEKYPALRKAQGVETILHHGDTIFIPPHWWHYIEYTDSGFSLALRAHDRFINKAIAVRNLFQHSIVDKGANYLMGQKWKDWKVSMANRRAEEV